MRTPMNSVIEPHLVVVRSKAAWDGDVMIDDMVASSGFGLAESGVVGEVGRDEADEQRDAQPPCLQPVLLEGASQGQADAHRHGRAYGGGDSRARRRALPAG